MADDPDAEPDGQRSLRSNDIAVPSRSESMSRYGTLLSAGSSVPIDDFGPRVETRKREASTPRENGAEPSSKRSTSVCATLEAGLTARATRARTTASNQRLDVTTEPDPTSRRPRAGALAGLRPDRPESVA